VGTISILPGRPIEWKSSASLSEIVGRVRFVGLPSTIPIYPPPEDCLDPTLGPARQKLNNPSVIEDKMSDYLTMAVFGRMHRGHRYRPLLVITSSAYRR